MATILNSKLQTRYYSIMASNPRPILNAPSNFSSTRPSEHEHHKDAKRRIVEGLGVPFNKGLQYSVTV